MLYKIKIKYNRWLFKKYGMERGALFENIPLIYLLNPLFSPSLYSLCEGEEWLTGLMEGLKKGEELNNAKREAN